MLRLSKKMLFAIEAVIDIAFHTDDERPVQSRDISARQGIPRRYLEQALQALVREGVLCGTRGPRGGYRLARDGKKTTVGDIVRVIRTIETTGDPIMETGGSELGEKVLRPLWRDFQEDMMKRLDKISVQSLCSQARKLGIEKNMGALLEADI